MMEEKEILERAEAVEEQPVAVDASTDDSDEVIVVRSRRHHEKPVDERGRFFVLRQILNLIFMIVGVAGVVITFTVGHMHGAIIFIIAMSFKMAECVLRYLK